jgi:hypothetical protein
LAAYEHIISYEILRFKHRFQLYHFAENRILVTYENLRALSIDGIFATGDTAYAAIDKGNHTLMSCQHAMPLGTAAGHNATANLLVLPAFSYSHPCRGMCLDLGPFGAVVGEDWEREVIFKGKDTKPINQFINDTLIYPPKDTLEEAFGGADPVISAAPAARKLHLAMMEDARMSRLAVKLDFAIHSGACTQALRNSSYPLTLWQYRKLVDSAPLLPAPHTSRPATRPTQICWCGPQCSAFDKHTRIRLLHTH